MIRNILFIATVIGTSQLQPLLQQFPKNCSNTVMKYKTMTVDRVEAYQYKTCYFFNWVCRHITRYRHVPQTQRIHYYEQDPTCCDGFIESDNNSCIEGCRIGKYGNSCEQNCTCPTNALQYCEKRSGRCTCLPGKSGETCEKDCPSNYFGTECKYPCLCEHNSSCDPVDGSCNCSYPGYTGQYCEQECNEGLYGLNCRKTCTCLETQTCNNVNGDCICKPGKTGENCTESCFNFTYGPNCEETCVCDPNNTLSCNIVDGTCQCKPGWGGDTCQSVCENEHYGMNCSSVCNCSTGEICEPVSRACFPHCMCKTIGTENCDELIQPCNCSVETKRDACNIANVTTVGQIKDIMTTVCQCKDDDMFCIPRNDTCNCREGWYGTQCEKVIDSCSGANEDCRRENIVGDDQMKSSNAGIIVGVTAGVLLIVITILIVIVFLIKKKRLEMHWPTKETKGVNETKVFSNAAYATESYNNDIITNSRHGDTKTYENAENKTQNQTENDSCYAETTDYHHIKFHPDRPETAATSVYSHLMEGKNESDTDAYVYDVSSKGHRMLSNVTDGQYALTRTKAATDDTYDSTEQARHLDNYDAYC